MCYQLARACLLLLAANFRKSSLSSFPQNNAFITSTAGEAEEAVDAVRRRERRRLDGGQRGLFRQRRHAGRRRVGADQALKKSKVEHSDTFTKMYEHSDIYEDVRTFGLFTE